MWEGRRRQTYKSGWKNLASVALQDKSWCRSDWSINMSRGKYHEEKDLAMAGQQCWQKNQWVEISCVYI